MSTRPVAVIRTGVANMASICAGLTRAGGAPDVTIDAQAIWQADHVVLPGVGAFGAGVAALAANGLDEVVRERAAAGKPLMAVCLGLQLLFESSDETDGVTGLGVLSGHIGRFEGDVHVPQLGWNQVAPSADCRLLQPGYAYFANSFRVAEAPDGCAVAWTEHGGRFVSALERGPLLACQFHPELSGPWGVALMQRWLEA